MLVYVPKGVTVDEPLKATFTIAEDGAAQQWRVLVIAEEGSRVAFMEEHAEGLPGYANGVAELHVGANANVEYVSFQHRHLETLHFASTAPRWRATPSSTGSPWRSGRRPARAAWSRA